LGPIEVRVMVESFLHASMFFITASSTPDMCLLPSFSRSDIPIPPVLPMNEVMAASCPP